MSKPLDLTEEFLLSKFQQHQLTLNYHRLQLQQLHRLKRERPFEPEDQKNCIQE